jgi:hypothetical protein
MAFVDLITRNSLARALNADPRAKFLKDLTPLAHLFSGRTRLPLYAAELIEKLKADQLLQKLTFLWKRLSRSDRGY